MVKEAQKQVFFHTFGHPKTDNIDSVVTKKVMRKAKEWETVGKKEMVY